MRGSETQRIRETEGRRTGETENQKIKRLKILESQKLQTDDVANGDDRHEREEKQEAGAVYPGLGGYRNRLPA